MSSGLLLFLAATTTIGLAWSARLPALRGRMERLAVGMTLGLLLQLWLPLLAAKLPGAGIALGPALALLAATLAAGLVIAWTWRPQPMPRGKTFQASLFAGAGTRPVAETALLFAALGAFLGWLFYTHSLRPTADGLTSAGISWEDQSGHAMYASSFLYSHNLVAFENPLLSGHPLAYPFLSDLLAASLARLGATLGQAFWWSGWYAAMTFLLVVWVIARDWLGSARRASFTLVLVLCTGGLGAADFVQGTLAGTPWREMLIRHDYANAWELNLHYQNVLTAVLLPMRSFLFGLPVALAALFLFWRSLEGGLAGCRRELLTAGLLTGLLPLVNAHACIVTAWCGLAFAGLVLARTMARPGRGDWARLAVCFGAPIVLLATPQLLWTRSQMAGAQPYLRFVPGWMADTATVREWLAYWLHNGGLRIPLGIVAWALAPPRLKKLTAPFLGLLVLGNLVAFQPFVFDNLKLFVPADLAIAALTVGLFASLWRRSRRCLWAILPLTALITASGVLSIWRECKLESLIVDWDGVRFAELVRRQSAPRAVFLTASELTHPVSVLTGRPLVLGYQGWLVDLGQPMGDRIADVREMFEGGPRAAQLLETYGVDFVVIGPPERREFPKLDERFIASQAIGHWQSGPYALYERRRGTEPASTMTISR